MSEYAKWSSAKYPYDELECGYCLSQHYSMCSDPKHAAIVKVVEKERDQISPGALLGNLAVVTKSHAAFLRLRKKFARFYPKRGK